MFKFLPDLMLHAPPAQLSVTVNCTVSVLYIFVKLRKNKCPRGCKSIKKTLKKYNLTNTTHIDISFVKKYSVGWSCFMSISLDKKTESTISNYLLFCRLFVMASFNMFLVYNVYSVHCNYSERVHCVFHAIAPYSH